MENHTAKGAKFRTFIFFKTFGFIMLCMKVLSLSVSTYACALWWVWLAFLMNLEPFSTSCLSR